MSVAISKGYCEHNMRRIFSSFCNSPPFSLLILSTNCASDVTGRLTFLIGPKFSEPSSLIRRRAREENRRVTVGAGKRGKKTARDCFRPYSLLNSFSTPPCLAISVLLPSYLRFIPLSYPPPLSAGSPTLPSSTSTLRPRHRSGEHGQPDNRAHPSPVRRLFRRHGGLPLPPRTPPPPRLRSCRAPSAVGGCRALLHRRITQRLLLGELQSAFVVRLRVERRRTTV